MTAPDRDGTPVPAGRIREHVPGAPWQPGDAEAIRAELQRRAGEIKPVAAWYIEGLDHPEHPSLGEQSSFCEACARRLATKGDSVRRELCSDSDTLRWCEVCGALLDFRLVSEDEVEAELRCWEETPPSEPLHWAELLQAMAEVAPQDWREPSDPPVEPSPLWSRVEAILRRAEGAS